MRSQITWGLFYTYEAETSEAIEDSCRMKRCRPRHSLRLMSLRLTKSMDNNSSQIEVSYSNRREVLLDLEL